MSKGIYFMVVKKWILIICYKSNVGTVRFFLLFTSIKAAWGVLRCFFCIIMKKQIIY